VVPDHRRLRRLRRRACRARRGGRDRSGDSAEAPRGPRVRAGGADAPWLPNSPGFLRLTPDAERAAKAELERAVERLPDAEVAFVTGDPARELARESELSDLMVIGCRGYGPAHAVVLGEVSDRLMRTAACPAMIVPGGVPTPLRDLFAPCEELRLDSAA
jgi:nucleotide-binding universal stress UspA family protein